MSYKSFSQKQDALKHTESKPNDRKDGSEQSQVQSKIIADASKDPAKDETIEGKFPQPTD